MPFGGMGGGMGGFGNMQQVRSFSKGLEKHGLAINVL